ncbi:hypothetical protein ZYGR_0P03120 [Zygosaccharomyces rouxii]|uniref:ZYRO0E07744p n=2 Tax=Zygosaccharomyces rouxii TaxID=4956 RepID=C5E4P5_ZYGRC|nr:uncharacterized protein ZYRO0E07744g [Zygosaccharomyces rouxii]KAH9198138.1 HSP20-like chaperone [Zygosaccharomyces rouxii]GAV49666.1 hypothetical protein ZYGR_0P03120 [Zygosaccharomyces rouxii]CAR31006.1 ZYRO0E07744p [Zygosaccharomyces rouxii]
MFSTPFFDFFDNINNEVENVHNILGYSRDRDYPSRRQLTSGRENDSGKIQKRPHRNNNQRLLSTRLNKWFDDDWSLSDFDLGPTNIVPPVDLFDHEENYEARITIPGVDDSKNINLEYHKDGNEIVVSGEVPSTVTEHNRDNVKVKEVVSGQFKRVITLPENPGVNAEEINANYKNGVLSLRIPKLKQSKKDNVRKIEVAGDE